MHTVVSHNGTWCDAVSTGMYHCDQLGDVSLLNTKCSRPPLTHVESQKNHQTNKTGTPRAAHNGNTWWLNIRCITPTMHYNEKKAFSPHPVWYTRWRMVMSICCMRTRYLPFKYTLCNKTKKWSYLRSLNNKITTSNASFDKQVNT